MTDKQENSGRFLVRSNTADYEVLFRELAKWVLDLLKNLMVVGVLQAFAQRSDSLLIKILSYVAWGALFVYITSYINEWLFHPFPDRMHRSKWWLGVGVAVSAITVACLIQVVALAITVGSTELAKIQALKP